MYTFMHFVQHNFYDIILITEARLTENKPINKIFIMGYKFFLTHGTNREGGACLDHFELEFFVFSPRHLELDILPDTLWISIHMNTSLVHF